MKTYLKRLSSHEFLTREETREIMINITKEKYSDTQISALLMAIQMRGITVDELLGFRDGLMETRLPVDLSPYKTIDIVGTGGDGKNTFNISTCSCFVVAASGYKVSKHGNFGATSVSGASNAIESHGAKFTDNHDKEMKSLEETNIVYLHAQKFARGMKFVGPVRKDMQIPTLFNLLGPIVNPCCPAYQLLGVANLSQMRLYASVYHKIGTTFGIVNSYDGYDEISLTDNFKVMTNTIEQVYSPADLKMKMVKPEEIYGGETKEDAMKIFDNVLQNKSTEGQKNVVLANSGFAIKLMEPNKTIEECISIARETIESGKAWSNFKKFIEINS